MANASTHDGVNEVFDWLENQNEMSNHAKALDVLSLISNNAAKFLDASDSITALLKQVIANQYDLRQNLPPFPLPGTLTHMKLENLSPAMQVAGAMLAWLETPINVLNSAGETISVKPVEVLNRISRRS